MRGLLKDGQTVIDAGCNDGGRILDVKDRLAGEGIGVDVIGIDQCTAEEMFRDYPKDVGKLTRRAKHNHSRMRFIHSSVDEVEGLEADVVACFGLSCSVERRQAAVLRLAEFLKPDGVMVLGVYHRGFRRMPFSVKCIGWRLDLLVSKSVFLKRVFACIEIKVMGKAEAAEHAKTCVGRHYQEGFGCNHGSTVDVL